MALAICFAMEGIIIPSHTNGFVMAESSYLFVMDAVAPIMIPLTFLT